MQKSVLVVLMCSTLFCDVTGMMRVLFFRSRRKKTAVHKVQLSKEQLSNNEEVAQLLSSVTDPLVRVVCAHNASDETLAIIAVAFGDRLEGLVVKGSQETPTEVCDVGLGFIAECCKNIKKLVIRGCKTQSFTGEVIQQLTSLERLELTYLPYQEGQEEENHGAAPKRGPLMFGKFKSLQQATITYGPFPYAMKGRGSSAVIKIIE